METTLPLPQFAALHAPALECDQVRHNVLLASLDGRAGEDSAPRRLWSLGGAGACALQQPGRPILLGELTEPQCHMLAEATRELDYPGVVGAGDTAPWFAARAAQLGLRFADAVPHQVYTLSDSPRYPEVWGCTRLAGLRDAALFADWTLALLGETVSHDPVPARERLERAVAEGRTQFWITGGRPVSMAALVRRTRDAGVVGGVYTLPALRGGGYASAVTAAVVDRIFGEGRSAACLTADLRNPAAGRCFERIGFKPHCRAWHCPRLGTLR